MRGTHRKAMGLAVSVWALLLPSCVLAGGAGQGQAAPKQSDKLLLEIMDMHERLATNEVFLAQANVVAAYLQAAQQSDEAMKVQVYQRVQRLLATIRHEAKGTSGEAPDTVRKMIPKTERQEQARITAARTRIAELAVALDAFELDVGRFPTTAEGLQALLKKPASNAEGWKGPYLRAPLQDPWGSDYVYSYPGQGNYDLRSAGPDRRQGTDDDITK